MKSIENKIFLKNRRSFLQQATLLSGSLITLPYAASVLAQPAQLETLRLSDKVLFIKGPNANVLAVVGNEGIIMVDGGHDSWFDALHQAIRENFPEQPIRALINTHWHKEQTGSNQAMGEQGVEIIAHENTMLWLGTEIWQHWSDTIFPPLPEAALPTTVVLDSGSIQLAELNIRLDYLWNSHTDGDISVYFEAENILVCGGLVSNGQWPVIDWWTGGYIGGMLDSFLSLLAIPDKDTRIIPAYGDIMTLAELEAQNQMYLTIFDRLHSFLIDSYSLEEVLAEKPTAEYDAKMGDPTQFVTLAFQSFKGHLRDPQNFRLLNIP